MSLGSKKYKGFLKQIVIKITSLVPYKIKLFLYKVPLVSFLIRKFLNFSLSSPEKISTAKIVSGPIKSYKIGIDFQSEKYYWLGTHEPKVQQIILKVAKRGMAIYDIGAHIGYFTILFSHLCKRKGKVFAFEPNPDNFQRLVQNIALNKIENIFPIKIAVAEKNGIVFFDKTESNSQSRLVGEQKPGDGGENIIKVETESLDGFVYKGKNPLPQIVKIDVEGAEGKVIKGMKRILREVRPLIICEIHNLEAAQEIWQVMGEGNYTFFDIEKGLSKINDFKNYQGGHIMAQPL